MEDQILNLKKLAENRRQMSELRSQKSCQLSEIDSWPEFVRSQNLEAFDRAVDGTSGASELTTVFDLDKTPDNGIKRISSFYVEC